VQAIRQAEATTRLLYPADRQLNTAALAEASNPTAPAAKVEAARIELANCAADLGMDQSDVDTLVALTRTNAGRPMTKQAQQASELKSIQALRERFGNDAGEAFAQAKALTKRDPRFAAFVNENQIGSDPRLVVRMAELARSSRNR
jgi:hypothetical protein